MRKSTKMRNETKTPCRELHVGELDHIRGGSVDVTTPAPRPPGPA